MKKALCIGVVFLVACSAKKTNKEVMVPFKTIQQTVWQLMQVDEYLSRQILTDTTIQPSSEKAKYYQKVFNLNKVNRVQFYTTMDYLDTHPVELKELMDSVEALSKREKLDFIKH
jgi:hypothetical protein